LIVARESSRRAGNIRSFYDAPEKHHGEYHKERFLREQRKKLEDRVDSGVRISSSSRKNSMQNNPPNMFLIKRTDLILFS
jgi:hypothetical protein